MLQDQPSNWEEGSAMSENKTKSTPASVDEFLSALVPEKRQRDARAVCELMQQVSGEPPVLWGPSIVGFGRYSYRYDSGRTGEAPQIGFSPRATSLVLYLLDGFPAHGELLSRLGKHKTGKSCLYINKLDDVDRAVLTALVTASLSAIQERYPED
jgi:hypothetical protein